MNKIAFVSAEVGVDSDIKTYSGGLGILAGDMLKSAGRLGLPVDVYSLVYHNGYSHQTVDPNGHQNYEPDPWDPSKKGFELLGEQSSVLVSGRRVFVQPWRKQYGSANLFLLDTRLGMNSDWDKMLTDRLYDPGGGEKWCKDYYRLCQGIVLAGAVGIEKALGENYELYHLNEGFPATIINVLLNSLGEEETRKLIWLTTHTPVPAAFDYISELSGKEALGEADFNRLMAYGGYNGSLSTSHLAANLSRGINAVSRRNAEICKSEIMNFIFGGKDIFHITNGIDLETWVSESMGDLYYRRLGDWINDPNVLLEADKLSIEEIVDAKMPAVTSLYNRIYKETGVEFDSAIPTIGFARRGATYKRSNLIFMDIKRLAKIARGNLQFVFAGKAHSSDGPGQKMLEQTCEGCCELRKEGVNAVFLEDYSMDKARDIVQGVFFWLNNPERPCESSGTSGMKSAVNGSPNLSIFDGWWCEGYNGRNGWVIAPNNHGNDLRVDANHLYQLLENEVIPAIMNGRVMEGLMRESIKLGAYFNTDRVVKEYAEKVWWPKERIFGRDLQLIAGL